MELQTLVQTIGYAGIFVIVFAESGLLFGFFLPGDSLLFTAGARFLPFIRTFAPIVAGIGNMHYPTFLIYNMVGGLLWGVGLTFAGYYLGSLIPDVDKYLIPIILGIIFISVFPAILHLIHNGHMRGKLIDSLKKLFKRL